MSAGPTVSPTARPPNRLVHPVLEPHDGRAQEPIPERSTSPRATSTLQQVDSLKALDPNRPIREADISADLPDTVPLRPSHGKGP